MGSIKGKQLAFIGGALVLTVLLYFANKVGKPTETKAQGLQEPKVDLKAHADSAVNLLPEKERSLIITLQQQTDGKLQGNGYDSISAILLSKSIAASAFYAEKSAVLTRTSDGWKNAGKLYYKATRFEKPFLKKALFEGAIHCFDESKKIDSTDLETLTLLGTCYVEGSNNPMTGIMMLRNVVSIDSSYIDAQVQLGLFAVQSGQMDKAIERFNKILKMKPDFIEAYIYLGQIHADMGNKKEAIKSLELYQQKSNDKIINQQVEQFINELKNS